MRLVRRYSFEAAHQLHDLPAEHPCSRLHGHGYQLEVAVHARVEDLDYRGMVIEYSELDAIVQTAVLDRYDHRFVNDFLDQPTVENMAPDIWECLHKHMSSGQSWAFYSIRLWETERSSVEYP